MKNKTILKNKFLRIFEIAPTGVQENSQKFGLKRGSFFAFLYPEPRLI